MSDRTDKASNAVTGGSLHLPLSLTVVTLLVMVGFQTLQLVRERQAISATHSGQEAAYTEARRVRLQFESIAKGTAVLATGGNSNAAAIVEALANAGVSIDQEGL